MSVWNPDNITDVAESVGIHSLPKDVVDHLARDVEYRIAQVLEEALKFMRKGKRVTLGTQDISHALRLLDVEPLYGYESTRPLRFGEASLGGMERLFYVEDEEVEFEKLVNSALPKVPREMSFTAHWLAVEGVQPSIPQNPMTNADGRSQDQRSQDLIPKTSSNTSDGLSVKPAVKHVLSKELQLYFERICAAILDDTVPNHFDLRNAAYASVRSDTGLGQLVPYFMHFISDKITHSLRSLTVLTHVLQLVAALLDNPSLDLAPYVPSTIPAVLTCLIGRNLGTPADGMAHFALRNLASSILLRLLRKFGNKAKSLRPRAAKSAVKAWLDPSKPFGSHYGAVLALTSIAGTDGVRSLIVPNLDVYDGILREGLADDSRREHAEAVVAAIMKALQTLEEDGSRSHGANGLPDGQALRQKLVDAVGEVIGNRVFETGGSALIAAVLEKDLFA
ncbi:histone H4-like TAF Taf6, SAGA complex subunit [Elasticomyces elasticus]|nr:histone H4-like TAF Taf6, SAGA complex subunit [Elasticomyces elasticus]